MWNILVFHIALSGCVTVLLLHTIFIFNDVNEVVKRKWIVRGTYREQNDGGHYFSVVSSNLWDLRSSDIINLLELCHYLLPLKPKSKYKQAKKGLNTKSDYIPPP